MIILPGAKPGRRYRTRARRMTGRAYAHRCVLSGHMTASPITQGEPQAALPPW